MSTTTDSTKATSNRFNLRIGLCQTIVNGDKHENLETARVAINQAVDQGARLIILPECFNCLYDTSTFHLYQEQIPDVSTKFDQVDQTSSPTTHFLASMARQHGVYIIGGSYPEKSQEPKKDEQGQLTGSLRDVIYNTSTVFNPDGTLIAKHRKVHLFDIDIPGKITFKESLTLSPGNSFTTFSIDADYLRKGMDSLHPNHNCETIRDVRFGLGICYDIRFAEYAQICRQQYNVDALVYPGAFNTVTGPAHWQYLQIARSLDNQVYTMAVSPARNPESAYQAYGHSSIISPWGETVVMATEKPSVMIGDIDIDRINEIRQQIPISMQRRPDLYTLHNTTNKH